MKPNSVLSDQDYYKIVEQLINYPNVEVYLNGCEKEYLPINSDFYQRLLSATEKQITKEYSLFNDILIANPEKDLEEIKGWSPRYKDLIRIKDVITRRLSQQSKDEVKSKIEEMHPYCTSEEFKSDISELCEKCPLTQWIKNGIENQILFEIKEMEQVLTPNDFQSYLVAETEKAKTIMSEVLQIEREQGKTYRGNRINVYIWNKEKIKVYNSYRKESSSQSKESISPPTTQLTQRQIALFYRYLSKAKLSDPISVQNRDRIAKKFGWTSSTSGQKVYDWFNKLNNTTERTAKGRYTLRDLEVVSELLDSHPQAKEIIEDEIKIAKRIN